jgi:hypothetical protein
MGHHEDEDEAQSHGLPGHAVVVRGGVMELKKLRSQVEVNFRDGDGYSVSVWASADLDADALARAAREEDEEALPHRRMQTSTVARVEAAGCTLHGDPPSLHYDLMLPDTPADTDLTALMAAFDDPRCNPVTR